MSKYKKIKLEIEIAVMKNKEIDPVQLTIFARSAKRGLRDALRTARISFGGITIKTIIDQASKDDIKELNKEAFMQSR